MPDQGGDLPIEAGHPRRVVVVDTGNLYGDLDRHAARQGAACPSQASDPHIGHILCAEDL